MLPYHHLEPAHSLRLLLQEPSAVPDAAATGQDQQQTEGLPRTGHRPAPKLVRQILRQSLVAEVGSG